MTIPAARRDVVLRVQPQLGLSQRRTCRALGWCRSTVRYRTRRPRDQRLACTTSADRTCDKSAS